MALAEAPLPESRQAAALRPMEGLLAQEQAPMPVLVGASALEPKQAAALEAAALHRASLLL